VKFVQAYVIHPRFPSSFHLVAAMRITVPTLPTPLTPYVASYIAKPAAIERLFQFLTGGGTTTLLTGAGVSVDSGVRAYRGKDGRYMNPNYKSVAHSYSSIA
jgi:NAD-dependent deacetylase sirtuin 4